MRLKIIYRKGLDENSFRCWNYFLFNKKNGKVYYFGYTENPKQRRRGYIRKNGMQYVIQRMNEEGMENFVMVVYHGSDRSSICRDREVADMHKWKTIRHIHANNPYACNVISSTGMNILHDLPLERRKEIRWKQSNPMKKHREKKYHSHVDAWVYYQLLSVGVTRNELALKVGKSPSFIYKCMHRHAKNNNMKKPNLNSRRKFTEKQEDEIYDLNYNKRISIPKLAEDFKTDTKTIQRCMKRSMERNKIKFVSRIISLNYEQEKIAYEQIYTHGKTKRQVAKDMMVGMAALESGIKRYAKRNKIENIPSLRHEKKNFSKNQIKYMIDQNTHHGKSLKKLAKEFSCSRVTVKKYMKKIKT